MKYREFLRQHLDAILSDDIRLPQGYHVIGHVILLRLKNEAKHLESEIGRLTLEYEPRGKSVIVQEGPTKGVTRHPSYRLVAGEHNTETLHIENGVKFRLDPLHITFSGGNRAERIRLPSLVDPNENVVDMFSCVGQFGLHIAARAKAKVTAIEINPLAFRYLEENIRLNRVGDTMVAKLGDCRKVSLKKEADRIVMGYLHDTIDFLDTAMEILSKEGGIIHMHCACPAGEVNSIRNTINTISFEHGYTAKVKKRIIKNYSPMINHYVFDIEENA